MARVRGGSGRNPSPLRAAVSICRASRALPGARSRPSPCSSRQLLQLDRARSSFRDALRHRFEGHGSGGGVRSMRWRHGWTAAWAGRRHHQPLALWSHGGGWRSSSATCRQAGEGGNGGESDVARARTRRASVSRKKATLREEREPRRRSRLGSGLGDARVSGASSRERTWTPVGKFTVPSMEMPCTAFSTTPRSSVGVTSTLGTFPARLSTPTLFSGLDCVFAPASRLMASASACDRDVRATSGKVRRQKAIEQKRGSRPLGTRPLRGETTLVVGCSGRR